MKAGQRDIFYLSAPSRQLAESSPYYESLRYDIYSTRLLPAVVGSGSPLDLDPSLADPDLMSDLLSQAPN
jgi:hypothetical protein